jgi:hypothetical protein
MPFKFSRVTSVRSEKRTIRISVTGKRCDARDRSDRAYVRPHESRVDSQNELKGFNRWDILKRCIFHSDRGSKYTSESLMNLLTMEDLQQSFSCVGMPGDNSWNESFFANFKKGMVH